MKPLPPPRPKPNKTSAQKSRPKQTPDQVLKSAEFQNRAKSANKYRSSVIALAKGKGVGSGLGSGSSNVRQQARMLISGKKPYGTTLATVGKTRRGQSRGR